MKVAEIDCSNYRGISFSSTTYKILTNILLSRSATDYIFRIQQKCIKKREFNEVMQELFIEFNNSYYSIMREVFYNILIEIVIRITMIQ